MRYFLDTEFAERPCTIDLISIGLVCDDGREFYAESSDVVWSDVNEWVVENVKPILRGGVYRMPRSKIRDGVLAFVGDDPDPEFFAYYGHYDWVVFCWLFGAMVNLPKGWPMWCYDLKQMSFDLGDIRIPKGPFGGVAEHDALEDARWNKWAYGYLLSQAGGEKRWRRTAAFR